MDVVGVVVSAVQFDVKGGICIIRVFPIKDVHFHLIVVTCRGRGRGCGRVWFRVGEVKQSLTHTAIGQVFDTGVSSAAAVQVTLTSEGRVRTGL